MVRYIRDEKLGVGDRIPTQDELRKLFGFGAATIGAAIQELREDGVLEVRDKVGVFVIDPNADGHAGRVVGLTVYSQAVSAYYGILLSLLQMELVRYGCRSEIFCCDNPGSRHEFTVADFPGLRRCIERNELDGLMHLDDFAPSEFAYFRSRELPVTFVGNAGNSSNAVFIDNLDMMHQAFGILRRKRPRRVLFLLSDGLRQFIGAKLESEGRRYGIPLEMWTGNSVPDADALADRYLQLPDAERADAIIAFDDVMTASFSVRLALNLPQASLPQLATVVIGNNLFAFASPHLYRFAIDLHQVARTAVELLLRTIAAPGSSSRIWLKTNLISDAANTG